MKGLPKIFFVPQNLSSSKCSVQWIYEILKDDLSQIASVEIVDDPRNFHMKTLYSFQHEFPEKVLVFCHGPTNSSPPFMQGVLSNLDLGTLDISNEQHPRLLYLHSCNGTKYCDILGLEGITTYTGSLDLLAGDVDELIAQTRNLYVEIITGILKLNNSSSIFSLVSNKYSEYAFFAQKLPYYWAEMYFATLSQARSQLTHYA